MRELSALGPEPESVLAPKTLMWGWSLPEAMSSRFTQPEARALRTARRRVMTRPCQAGRHRDLRRARFVREHYQPGMLAEKLHIFVEAWLQWY